MENPSKKHFTDSATLFGTPTAANGTKPELDHTTSLPIVGGATRRYESEMPGYRSMVRMLRCMLASPVFTLGRRLSRIRVNRRRNRVDRRQNSAG